jgi:hypothetical protein
VIAFADPLEVEVVLLHLNELVIVFGLLLQTNDTIIHVLQESNKALIGILIV